jgi:hypothetical protein
MENRVDNSFRLVWTITALRRGDGETTLAVLLIDYDGIQVGCGQR